MCYNILYKDFIFGEAMSNYKNDEKGKVVDKEKHSFQTIKARPVKLKENYDYFGLRWYRRFFGRLSILFVLLLFKFIIGPIFFGFKVINKKKLKAAKKEKKGYIFVANHVHPLDSFLTASAIFTKKLYFTMLMTNLGIPVAGKLLKFLGGVPIPDQRSFLREFREQMSIVLKRGAWIAVYPESALELYCDHIRPFEKGAIRFALDNNVDILPMVYVFKKPTGLYRLYKRKPLFHLHILDPFKLEIKASNKETLIYNSNKLRDIMSVYLEEQNIIYKKYNKNPRS